VYMTVDFVQNGGGGVHNFVQQNCAKYLYCQISILHELEYYVPVKCEFSYKFIKVVSVFHFGHRKCHFLFPKYCPKLPKICRNCFYTCWYKRYQEALTF